MCTPSYSVNEQKEHYPDYAEQLKPYLRALPEIAGVDSPIRRNPAPGIMSGFFEWKTDGQRKRPFKIHLQNNAIMSLAGIWETWRPGTPHERLSFSILTTSANRFMRTIRDRMPVILDNSAEEDWLNPEIHERKALEEILQPCPNEWLTAVEVSPLVNSAKNNGPELLQPAVGNHTENMPQRDLFAD
jgi:putative SOS response-associated peptidase YedK